MHLYVCHLTLHEPLFFATRELGRLYETGRYLHNYALSYALGLAQAPWFNREQVPRYKEDLGGLTSVYVTPARPERTSFQLATFKYGEEILHVEMQQATRNTPSFGRAKELAPQSRFVCYVISQESLRLPRWVRLGKWHSKALLEVKEEPAVERDGAYTAACPLNPLDVPANVLRAFDIISMPPASLVANARCYGPHYALPGDQGLPVGMRYVFP
ncbi:MAG: type I-D CRISPR-associated protein Cas5/Csc1 [Chloroflexaceae bacterium]